MVFNCKYIGLIFRFNLILHEEWKGKNEVNFFFVKPSGRWDLLNICEIFLGAYVTVVI